MRLILAFLFTSAAAYAQPANVVAISHRGEHLHHPENTMPAYRAALEAGADFIETDVRTTSDGKLVIMHDATVDRCTDGHGDVAGMTFDEIRKLDAGAQIRPTFKGTQVPTFEEVLEFARGKIGVYIDAKRISAPTWWRLYASLAWRITWWSTAAWSCIAACKSWSRGSK